MAQANTGRLVANICMSQIRQYSNDLAEFYAGDEGRFTRMVVDQGKTIPSASPCGWCDHIVNLTKHCIDYHLDELLAIYTRLKSWGHEVSLDEVGYEQQANGTTE